MDSTTIFKHRIAVAVLEQRGQAVEDYVRSFIAEEITDEALVAGLRRLKADEKARLLHQDEQSMKAALEQKANGEEVSGAGI